MKNEIIKTEVIIIGSGAVGSATAYFLAKSGVDVIVLEKDNVANGSSVRNGGLNKMNTRGKGELSIAMMGVRETWPKLREELLKDGITDIEYKTTGGYRTAVDESQMEIMQKFYPTAQEFGIHVEYMTGNDLRKRCPVFSKDIYGAAYCPEEGRANPLKTTLGLYIKNRQMGVRYYDNDKVTRIELIRGEARRVHTESGKIYEADKILVAACHGSREILRTVDIDLPFIHPLCEIFVTEPVPHILDEIFIGELGGYYGHQTEHGSFVFGGGSYIGEYQLEGKHVEYRLTPDTVPAGVKGFYKLFPSLKKVKIIRSWSGWHDRTNDNTACVGAISEIPGLYIAAGFSGHGFGISVPMGKVVSELIMEKKLSADISAMKWNRFAPLDSFSGYKVTK